MSFKLEFLMAGILVTTPWGGSSSVKAHAPAPLPIPQISLIAPIKPLNLAPLPTLDYVQLAYAPMGTYGNDYPAGQCTHGAASMKGDIPDWGNANQWDDAARAAGKTVSAVPIIGAVAQTDRGEFGHVAVVDAIVGDQVQITEMNYDYHGGVRQSWWPIASYIYIYI